MRGIGKTMIKHWKSRYWGIPNGNGKELVKGGIEDLNETGKES